MLTRSQVARRLGKSLATVRRLEGSSLHPRRDDNGVHWFDESEVKRLADSRRTTRRMPERAPPQPAECRDRVKRSDWWLQRLERAEPDDVDASSEPEEDEQQGPPDAARSLEMERLESRVRDLEHRLAYHAAEEVRASRVRALEHETIARQLLEELGSLSDRQLRRLGFATLDEVVALVDEALAR